MKRNTVQPVTSFTPATLKSAVRSAVEDEDRSRNFVIFRKKEDTDEDVSRTVAGILDDINEKPMIVECRRIGKIEHGKDRPIKVKLTSSDAVSHVLSKAKYLKKSSGNKGTFLAPDRSPEERKVHSTLVGQLKTEMKTNPDRYHFIRGGQIISVEKATSTTTEGHM